MTTVPPAFVDLGHDVLQLDTRMAGYAGITAGYLLATPRPCLVETGTALSAPTVIAALHAAGVGPTDLATIVVTHIHLDHAGGVGDVARAFPAAEVVVHPAGARHLIDPSRLLASAGTVFGSALTEVFGLLAPTEQRQLRPLSDPAGAAAGTTLGAVDLGGGRTLEALHAPGHARHHVGLLDSTTGDLYVGDAAGIYVPEADELRPATPPPDFDLADALATLSAFGERAPTRLLFSHFGPVTEVDRSLSRAAEELAVWTQEVRAARGDGLDLDHAVTQVQERTRDRYRAFFRAEPAVVAKFDRLISDTTNVAGIVRWLDRQEGLSAPPRDPLKG